MISKWNLALLKMIAEESNPMVRDFLLLTFSKDKNFMKAIRSLCKNTLKGNLKLNAKDKDKLEAYLKEIKYFAVKRNATRPKLSQTGSGFLSVLVPIAAALLGPLIDGAFKKNGNDTA